MTVFGISMVRDEDDIIGLSLNHALWHVDHVLVLDNGSVDRTREILDSMPRTTVIDDPEVGYYQARKMTDLASRARAEGADWVMPFDADEFFCAGSGLVRNVLEGQPEEYDSVEADFFHHCMTGRDEPGPDIVAQWVWREGQSRIPKVCARTRPGLEFTQGNHGALYFGQPALPSPDRMIVHHFPYRSVEQQRRKVIQGAAAYEASDLPEGQGSHWRDMAAAIRADPAEAERMFRRWYRDDPAAAGMVRDPTPIRREPAV